MFEKEAEEIANKRCHEIMCFGHCSFSSPKHHRCGEWHREYNCAKEGIEFGYNKANEWHDLEKNPSDLPSKGRLVICYLKEDVFDVGIFKKEIELQCGKERIRKWAYFELPEELK